MRFLRNAVLPVFVSGIWISISEFFRNEFLFKSYWIGHYGKLGIAFPAAPVNGAVWGIWSLVFAATIFVLLKKFTVVQTTLLSWFTGFVLMWLVTGNLGVLPCRLLYFAVPLSLLESFVAVLLVKKLT